MDSRSSAPPPDRQGLAFRDNPFPVPDSELPMLIEKTHAPIVSVGALLSPDDWEAVHWDSGREEPKNLQEAQALLALRIASPHAPDGPEVQGAYDALELS